MNNYQVVLFDVDGVLIRPPRLFSEVYCQKYKVDLEKLESFYKSEEFRACSLGKMDLKQAIVAHNDKWCWKGDPAELINEWLEAENSPNVELLKVVGKLRKDGTKVYITTEQEKYRRDFLNKIVFKEKFDGIFASCDLGLHKDTIDFWQKILSILVQNNPHLAPNDIIYFDDKQKIVDLAHAVGINAFVYTSVDEVKKVLS